MQEVRELIDSLIGEWYSSRTTEFDDKEMFVISEELSCPKCPRKFYAHTTSIRELMNHVLDELNKLEVGAHE